MPEGCGGALEAAAAAHRGALVPATPEQRHNTLMGLRSCTVLHDVTKEEAKATFALLKEHLADVPHDILDAACSAYANEPGTRFFPKSAGELRVFINPMVSARRARAVRLKMLADEARQRDERAAYLAQPPEPMSEEQVREENALMKRLGLSTRWRLDGSSYQLQPGDEDPVQPEEQAQEEQMA